ncbi:MAG: hypothetical protein MUP71_13630 [Candidatus Aminicenantes bacterium]|nr:hypothetical protein [Candidatus Aminicenantes bacterium]
MIKTAPTDIRRRLGCSALFGIMVVAGIVTFLVLHYQLGRPQKVGAQIPSPFPILVIGPGPTPTVRIVDVADLTGAASEPRAFIIPSERAAAIQSALDKEMRAEEERARLKGDNEAYRRASFTIEQTAPGRQLIRLDYSRNGMDAIVRTTTWYDATSQGVEPRMYGRGMVNGMLIFLSAMIGAVISAAIGVGWRLVRGKRG